MIINNVKLVLENEVVHGSLEVQDGEIRAFAESQSRLPEAMDGEGGWLLPGLIELHTDNLDKFFTPRPKVDWPAHSAMSSHDALMVASGITTVLDAVAIGDVRDGGDRLENLEKMINTIEETQKRGVNRAEHRLHLRCELPHHTTLPLFEKLVQREPVTLVSLMDHSPGQRQFANREKYREYYRGKYSLTDAQMQQYEEEQLALAARWSQPNRESIAALCRARQIALASHDDATHAHVAESHQLGSVIAEFPTTFEAAEASISELTALAKELLTAEVKKTEPGKKAQAALDALESYLQRETVYTGNARLLAAELAEALEALPSQDFVPGDVNGNGKIDTADYAMAKRAFLRTYSLSDGQFERADINGNSKLDASEYAMIKRHYLKTYTIPGAENK